MKNIHLIPTDKPSNITIRKRTGELVYDAEPFTHDEYDVISNQNIYITSDEEIKEGDWFIALDGSNDIYKANKVWLDIIKENSNPSQKIILTTDQDLINDGVQAIDDEFLEWFVNNSSCDSVKIDLVPVNEFGSEITVGGYGFDKFKYKIIIPKEEPNPFELPKALPDDVFFKSLEEPKQETLEEVVFIKKAIDFYWSQYNSNHIDNLKDFEVSKKIIEQLKNK